jgi:hypothetical protein
MPDVAVNTELVAYCGLYCGACKAYVRGKCQGCHENSKATWCRVRSCCSAKPIATCAECAEFPDPRSCKKYNNLIAKLFGLVFRSDRAACIDQIRQIGLMGHAQAMAEMGKPAIRRQP